MSDDLTLKIGASTGRLETDINNAQASLAKFIGSVNSAAFNMAAASKETEKLGHATAGTTREFIVLGHEVISGNFSRIPGSLMVLAERSGNLTGIVASLASAFTLTNVAIGVGIIALGKWALSSYEAEKGASHIQIALAATGQATLLTKDQIKGLVDQLSDLSHVSKDDATDAIATLSRTVGITRDQAVQLIKILPDVAAGLGVDVKQAAKISSEALRDTEKSFRMLQERYDLFSKDQIKAFLALEKIGDKAGEQQIIIDALGEHFSGLNGKVVSFTNKMEDLWKSLWKTNDEMERMNALQHGFVEEKAVVPAAIPKESSAEKSADVAHRKALKEKEDLIAESDRKITAEKDKTAKHLASIQEHEIKAQAKQWDNFFNAFNGGIRGMVTGTMTMNQAMKNIATDLLMTWIRAIEKMAAHWIAKEAIQTSATVAGDATRTASNKAATTASSGFSFAATIKEIEADAARTYAGVFGFLAPAMGPLAAIPAGASAALVGAMSAMVPSFDVGTPYVPQTGLALIHKGERIITAADNARGGGGDQYHISVSAIDQRGLKDFFMNNKDLIAQSLGKAGRNGHPVTRS